MLEEKNISKHITYKEATYSSTAQKLGIQNIPSEYNLLNMKELAENVFEKIRIKLNKKIKVNSFFRNPQLNKAVGGSNTSQHLCQNDSSAIDITNDGTYTNKQLFDLIVEMWKNKEIEFDQLIWEFGTDNEPSWIHISYSSVKNRGQILKINKSGTKNLNK